MGKTVRIPIRVSDLEKERFEEAAQRDGVSVSAWFRWLGENRIEEQAHPERLPRTQAGRVAALHSKNGAAGRPEPVAFIPGFGLDEED